VHLEGLGKEILCVSAIRTSKRQIVDSVTNRAGYRPVSAVYRVSQPPA
jgi:hypothetical protein